MVIVGSASLQRPDALGLYSTVSTIANGLHPKTPNWRVLNVLHRVASQVGALDVGYRAGVGDLSKVKFLYLLGTVSYKGHHTPGNFEAMIACNEL